jgi:hypothetical protein
MIKNFKWLFLVSLTFIACNNNDETVVDQNSADGLPLTAGSANFSKFVALGESFAAGYSDGALFKAGQEGSYPNVLAQQFALVGGGAFATPLMADNIGGFAGIPTIGKRLWFDGKVPVPVQGTPTTIPTTVLTGGFNNFGVPGAKSFHLVAPGYGNLAGLATGVANPYFARFATSPTTTVLADALAQSPTFFSLWIGGNDVLGYATSGGVGVNQTGNQNPATYGSNDITDPALFAKVYNDLVAGLTGKSPKGVVANLPYVNTLPYFTAVPTNAVPGLPAASAAQLNPLFGAINQVAIAAGMPSRFNTLVVDDNNPATTENNPILISDETLPNLATPIATALTPLLGASTAALVGDLYGKTRHAKSTVATDRDFVLLTARGIIGTSNASAPAPFNVFGISFPLSDANVLIPSEIAEIKIATDAYNTTIKSFADAKGLAFVDAKAIMDQLSTTGITANGYKTTANYVTGGAFSLDGIHPSPRGYALIANKFIEAINSKYGSNLKGVDLSNYRIMFPPSL